MIRILIALSLTLVLFQNCSQYETLKGSSKGEVVIGSASQFYKITHAPLSFPNDLYRAEIDLRSGSASITNELGTQSCQLEQQHHVKLIELLSSAEICEPAPPPPGTPVCLAIGVEDIELSDEVNDVRLRPNICYSGIFLCSGKDEQLRQILIEIRDTALNCTP